MEVIFKNLFLKDLKVAPVQIQNAAQMAILKLISSDNLKDCDLDITPIVGYEKKKFYKIRIGDWRIGLEYLKPECLLIRLLHRGTIYKKFP